MLIHLCKQYWILYIVSKHIFLSFLFKLKPLSKTEQIYTHTKSTHIIVREKQHATTPTNNNTIVVMSERHHDIFEGRQPVLCVSMRFHLLNCKRTSQKPEVK